MLANMTNRIAHRFGNHGSGLGARRAPPTLASAAGGRQACEDIAGVLFVKDTRDPHGNCITGEAEEDCGYVEPVSTGKGDGLSCAVHGSLFPPVLELVGSE